jgi:hypothetical protein
MITLKESILGSTNSGRKSMILKIIVDIAERFYNSDWKINQEDVNTLNDIWKENKLDIPGCEWVFVEYEGLKYRPNKINYTFQNGYKKFFIVSVHTNLPYRESTIMNVISDSELENEIKTLVVTRDEEKMIEITKNLDDDFFKAYNEKIEKVFKIKNEYNRTKNFRGQYILKHD